MAVTVAVAVAFVLLSFVSPLFLLGALLMPIAGAFALAVIEARFAHSFPMPEATVGGLTRLVAALNAGTLPMGGRDSIDDEAGIWPRLRRVVSLSLSIPEDEIFPHSRFVEDLLVG